MPTIASFFGITIYMYWADHRPAHLHAIYAENEALFSIETGDVIDGDLPRPQRRVVQGWIEQCRADLMENWRRGQDMIPFERVRGPEDGE